MEVVDCYHWGFIITNIIQLLGMSFIMLYALIKLGKKNITINLQQQQHTAKIDNIRKDHSETLESIRLEMLRREEDSNRHWIESEKETLKVLNGVSNLLDLSEKINKVETDKIIGQLADIQTKLTNNIKTHSK